jgi:TPP-dependent pyruvate/acetoin dehydrogenase alpha subunit
LDFMEPDNLELYRSLYRIRRFEETVLENFSKGVFFGTTHTYLGQEANAVGVLSHLTLSDIVVSNHRCHGHFLAYGGEPQGLFAELMGKQSGVCGGRGGSQHLHWRNFYSNGILGGTIPLATGMALAEKLKKSDAIVIAFLGDGALGEGVVYEAFNLASLWKIPILYIVENNRIAQTTPIELALAGSIAGRFSAFGIPAMEMDSSDVLEIWAASGKLLQAVRGSGSPQALVLQTCRFGPHSKGDDTRPKDAIDELRSRRDPLAIHSARLDKECLASITRVIDGEINLAFQKAKAEPFPQPHNPATI